MKLKTRFILCIFMMIGCLSFLQANPNFTAAEQKALDDLMQYRLYVNTLTSTQAIAKLDEYRSTHFTAALTAGFSEEAKLVLDAFIELEQLTYYQVTNSKDPKIQPIATAQYDKLQGWMDSHKSETPNKWMYCAAAEAFNWYLAYLPVSQIMSKGMLPKEYYEAALKQDASMTYALCGLGQWQYYAPGIAGGGKKVARATFEKAVAGAKNDADLFTAHALLSQSLFEAKDTAGATRELAAAEAAAPGSKKVARFRQVNAKGMCWFDFANDMETNRAKLGAALAN